MEPHRSRALGPEAAAEAQQQARKLQDSFLMAERSERAVAEVVAITGMHGLDGVAVFRGVLRRSSGEAHAHLEAPLAPQGLEAWLSEGDEEECVVAVIESRPQALIPVRWRLHLTLLLLTLASTTWAGAVHRGINLLAERGRWFEAIGGDRDHVLQKLRFGSNNSASSRVCRNSQSAG